MRGRRISPFGVAVGVLVLLVVAFVVRGSLLQTAHIELPAEEDVSSPGTSQGSESVRLDRVEVTPATVQSAIAALARPENYSRTVTVRRYWSGGSAVATAQVQVLGAYSRCDLSEGGVICHTVTNGIETALWYGDGMAVYRADALLSADAEQGIPTYESVLALDISRIAAADYRLLGELACIYVETDADELGYAERYYISVDTGLLVAAEKLCGDEMIYRMEAAEVTLSVVAEEAFLLPDGTALEA